MKTGLIGYGYWGRIIDSKLENNDLNPPFDDSDWIFIATPPDTHYELTKKFLLRNKNVFCEKPLTLNLEQAVELVKLANSKKVKLYVDNIFLFRDEIKNIKLEPFKFIEFKWLKLGPHKHDLITDLLYHDLYLLIHFLGVDEIKNISYAVRENDKLKVSFEYGITKVKIHYDRNWLGTKCKLIETENQSINLSTPKNDPLKESIEACFSNQIDYTYNHYLSLETLKLLKLFL